MDITKVLDWKIAIEKYLKGDDISPILCRIIDPLISVIIASYLFERFYFKYQFLDFTDYKAILYFIVKGGFVIPASLFLTVHLMLNFLIRGFLSLTEKGVIKWLSKFIPNFSTNRNVKTAKYISKLSAEVEETIVFAKTEIINVQRIFEVCIKMIIFSIFYYCITPYYGLTLFIIVMAILTAGMSALWLIYMFFKFVPMVLHAVSMGEEDASPEPELP